MKKTLSRGDSPRLLVMQSIIAAIEIHQEAAFNDLFRRHLYRLRWARVHRLGTYVQTGEWW